MKKIIGISLTVIMTLVLLSGPASASIVLFSEDFDGYPDNVTPDAGIPLIEEEADEFWYGGRFESYEGGTISQDTAVRYGDYTRFEDEAGILFNISTVDHIGVTLTFDWKTHQVESTDYLVVGYFLGDLNYGPGERYRDFYNEDFGGNHDAAVDWWNR